MADYWAERQPVRAKITRPLAHRLELRVDAKTITDLERKAKEKGLGPSTLARMWIIERLQSGN